MKILKILVLTWMLALFVGCASMPSGGSVAELGDKSKGVLLVSVTSERGKQTHDAWFYVRKKGEIDKNTRLAASGFSMFGKSNDFPQRSSRTGRLLAIPLEPGEYELFSWTLYIQVFGGYGYISPKVAPPPLAVSVAAGKVTYLGYLHLDTLMGANVFGLSIPGGGRPFVTDNFEEDRALMASKFPMLAVWPLEKAELDGTKWSASQ